MRIRKIQPVKCLLLGILASVSTSCWRDDRCVDYRLVTSENFMGHRFTEYQSDARVYFGPSRGRLDTGNTSFIVRGRKLLVLFHHQKEFWELEQPVVLETLVSAGETETLAKARDLAAATVDVVARGGEAENEHRWKFSIFQERARLRQEIELWAEGGEAQHQQSFWAVVGAAADLSPLTGGWFDKLPSIPGIPSRAVLVTRNPFGPQSSEEVDMTGATCKKWSPRGVYDVPADYRRAEFDLSAILRLVGAAKDAPLEVVDFLSDK